MALSRGDVNVVRTILLYAKEPSNVVIDDLFTEKFNRYALSATKGLWTDSAAPRRQRTLRHLASGSKGSLLGVSRGKKKSCLEGAIQAPSATSTQGWVHASGILAFMIDGYRISLSQRLKIHSALKDTPMPCSWVDLMMWAAVSGQPELARALWEKTNDPLRAAVMASQLCRRLHTKPALRADRDDLLRQSLAYEDLALDLLDSIRDSDDAEPLLCLVPWEWYRPAGEKARRVLLWEASSLDSAGEDDGWLSVPCMRVVSHRHAQHTLDKHFAGDFPGSPAKVSTRASLLKVLLQACLPFLPVIDISPCVQPPNVPLAASDFVAENDLAEGREFDPDTIHLAHAFHERNIKIRHDCPEGSATENSPCSPTLTTDPAALLEAHVRNMSLKPQTGSDGWLLVV